MLYNILPPVLIILSLAGIILILIKKAPEVAKIKKEESEEKEKLDLAYREKLGFSKKISSKVKNVNWGGFKNSLLGFLEKLTRRSRLIFLKLENSFKNMSDKLRKSRSKNSQEIISELREESRVDEIEEEKISKPFVSEPVVTSRTRGELKDRLEELLIDRIAVNPKDIEAYERLGEYYMEIGNHEHAKECYRQVMKLNPTNKSVRYKMRRLERIIGG